MAKIKELTKMKILVGVYFLICVVGSVTAVWAEVKNSDDWIVDEGEKVWDKTLEGAKVAEDKVNEAKAAIGYKETSYGEGYTFDEERWNLCLTHHRMYGTWVGPDCPERIRRGKP